MYSRHMIHLMLGRTFNAAIQNLMGYVLNYEDKDLTGFFTGMLCTSEEDGTLVFKTTQKVALENDNSAKFNSGLDDQFKVELCDYESIGINNQSAYLKNFFIRLYDKTVTINRETKEAALNICIYLPMYDEAQWSLAKLLIKAINEQNRNINVDLFFFSADLAYLFTSSHEQSDELPTRIMQYEQVAHSVIKDAIEQKKDYLTGKRLGHIIVMQNCNAKGLSLDLDWNAFVRILGEYAIATMNAYTDIFQQNANLDGRPIHAFGLCVLNLDKYYYVKYLLSKAYVTILEREGVDSKNIDVNVPSHVVQNALLGDGNRYKFYDHFYEQRVKGYLADGRNEEEINVKAVSDIDSDVEKFIQVITAFLNDDSLSLPSKRVTLAQLLGMDDEMITGDMFNPEQLLFRDSYADCIEMFVRSNNALLSKTPPANMYVEIPGSEAQLQKDYPDNLKAYAVLHETDLDFSRMAKDLKDYEVKIRRQTEYIRTLEKDLSECKLQERQSSEKNKILTQDGFKYGDVIYKTFQIENIPLEKNYVPVKKTLPKSVDLRKYFSSIKNQGSNGSCVSFSLTSIFEYILSKQNLLKEDLSERYLYYNARIEALKRQGKNEANLVDNGTSFFDAIKSLQLDGICREVLCEYSSENGIDLKPTDDAYKDGRTRLITEAMNVKMTESDIKSALSEGCPVAVAVRLFDSFANMSHGFVPLPDDDEIRAVENENIDSSHAMVICGYSDENKVFVVRNSWGTSFGDKGYCYIPYSYITNEHLTLGACIITGTNIVPADQVKDVRSHEVVPFDKHNPEINAAIIKTLIGEAVQLKNSLVHNRTDLYTSYTLLEKKIVNPEVRSDLIKGTKERLEWEVQEIRTQKNENSECERKRTKELDKKNIKVNIYFFGVVLLCMIIGIILDAVDIDEVIDEDIIDGFVNVFLIVLGVALLGLGVWWLLYLRRRRRIHKEHSQVNDELENLEDARLTGGSIGAGNLGLYLRALNIRMFMPWLVIRKLSEKNRFLEQKYQVMVNYTNNLNEWYMSEKRKISAMKPDMREPFISLLSNDTLDKYYIKHAEEITKDVRLSALFKSEQYSIEDNDIISFQNKLKNRIISTLEDSLKGFSVYKYLTGKTNFEFAKEREFDIHGMLNKLENKSEIFIRLGTSPETDESINATTTVLMSSDVSDDMNTWNEQFKQDFSVPVTHIDITSPFKFSFLQMKRLPLDECIDLYDPKLFN